MHLASKTFISTDVDNIRISLELELDIHVQFIDRALLLLLKAQMTLPSISVVFAAGCATLSKITWAWLDKRK